MSESNENLTGHTHAAAARSTWRDSTGVVRRVDRLDATPFTDHSNRGRSRSGGMCGRRSLAGDGCRCTRRAADRSVRPPALAAALALGNQVAAGPLAVAHDLVLGTGSSAD